MEGKNFGTVYTEIYLLILKTQYDFCTHIYLLQNSNEKYLLLYRAC